jgi:hypothetical protein
MAQSQGSRDRLRRPNGPPRGLGGPSVVGTTANRVRALLLAVVLVTPAGCSHAKQHASTATPSGGMQLKLTSAQPTYSRGERVDIKAELINAGAAACQAYNTPQGALLIVNLADDGKPVLPQLTIGSYIDGMSNYLRNSLVRVDPGATFSMDFTSEFQTARPAANDQSNTSVWAVDQPGAYEMSMRYVPTPIPNGPPDLCPASGDPADVKFTVGR